ncbi:MAG: hypothetical protein LBR79_03115 [Oscillospiraceae bacterium]|nr:hypothetical protein [Oscillospiraceae bacterium]
MNLIIWSCLKIIEIPSFPPAPGGGGKILSNNLTHNQNKTGCNAFFFQNITIR